MANENENPPAPKPEATSFEKIIDALTQQNKALQEQLGKKEIAQADLKEHSSKLEEIVRKLGELKAAPEIKPQETLLDSVLRILGWEK